MRTRVKICGITRPDDGVVAAEAGCDAIGLVFWAGSQRCVSLQQAEAIIAALPPMVTRVALFVDPSEDQVEATLAALPIDLLQFHGRESAEFCARFAHDYIKAIAMGDAQSPEQQMQKHEKAKGFLLDSHASGAAGGSGKTFDWSRWPSLKDHALVLAGGLDATNVAQAIKQTRPYAVDVSSGVETSPGIKDPKRIQEFLNEVSRVDSHQV